MDIFKQFNFKPVTLLKVAGIVLAAVVLLAVVALFFRIAGSSFSAVRSTVMNQSAPSFVTSDIGYDENMYAAKGEAAYYGGSDAGMALSTRNIAPAPQGTGTTGDTAEEFEVTDYSATVETRRLDDTCNAVSDLKAREDIIFENENRFERGCNYTFKVKTAAVDEVVALIKKLDLKDFSKNTYTIQSQIEDFTSETEILQKKLDSVTATLSDAMDAYDKISKLATSARDVESLAKIIDSKLQLIEHLTQERININEQLDRFARAKAEALDRLDYTYFRVNVVENKYIDGRAIKDSWQAAIKDFVRNVNQTLQDITINLVAMALVLAQYVLYLFIVLIVAKYAWKFARSLWEK